MSGLKFNSDEPHWDCKVPGAHAGLGWSSDPRASSVPKTGLPKSHVASERAKTLKELNQSHCENVRGSEGWEWSSEHVYT